MLNTKHLLTKRGLIISFRLPQVMTRNDCIPHGLQYYDLKYSTVCKDEMMEQENRVDNLLWTMATKHIKQ